MGNRWGWRALAVPLVIDGVRTPGGPWSPGDGSLVMEPLNGSALLVFDTSGLRPWCVASGTLRARLLAGPVRPAAWVSLETGVAELPDDAAHQPDAPLVLALKPAFSGGSGPVEVAAMEPGDGASLAVTEQPGCV